MTTAIRLGTCLAAASMIGCARSPIEFEFRRAPENSPLKDASVDATRLQMLAPFRPRPVGVTDDHGRVRLRVERADTMNVSVDVDDNTEWWAIVFPVPVETDWSPWMTLEHFRGPPTEYKVEMRFRHTREIRP